MERKQRILLVHNYYKISGGEDCVVSNEKKLLEENGHEVVLYTRNNAEIDKFGIGKKLRFPFNAVYNRKTYRDVKKIIEQEKIDIVHVHNTLSLISPAVYYAAVDSKVPVVQTIHNFRMICAGATLFRDGHVCEDCLTNGFRCAIKHKCYRNSRLQTRVSVAILRKHRKRGIYQKINYICLTEFNKRKLMSYKDLREEQIFVKPNFVESPVCVKPYDERENQFIYVGRLDELKGIDCLFRAWISMGNSAPQLIICGDGPMMEWCKKQITDHGITNIEMMGFIDNATARELIGKSKALILPTKWYEGFPMTIVESFSVGTPVIGSDIGNVGDIVKENVNGWKVNPNDETDIVKAVLNCHDIVNSVVEDFQNYTKEKNYEMLMQIYKSVLS